ncbi:MAG TPA: phosphate ABC transporter permease subunit PstC [Candidatus Limnocylindria bacterium]|nr:phosphate ABC transporter permease subunit PstC [Candidatus Limnocylindria bacterium]
MTAPAIERPLQATDLRIASRRRRREGLIRVLFLAAAGFSLVVSAAIVVSLFGNAATFFVEVDKSSLVTDGWFPRRGMFDIATIVAGTLVIAGIAMVVATPLGLGAGIYLSEYASARSRRILKPIVEILASIPSVVLGFFALTWISPNLVQPLTGAPLSNMLAAGLAVGILITPLVASVSEDALHAVPNYLREASYGLGARRRTTSLQVVFPAAISGIVAALLLALSRAIGETMVVSIAAGGTGGSLFEINPLQPGQTMTAAMTALAIGSDRVRGAELTFESLFFVGLLLFAMTLALNLASEAFVRRVRRRY